ncbi:MAG: M42 family metallopeptidase [Capsulimonadaceae bacterium]|nr:M42 family metallopeptidase [Capsulimonadaceae bacterium]
MSQQETPSITLLEELLSAPSPSGYEQPASSLWRQAVKGYADDVKADVLGNSYAILNAAGSPKVMLAGHCDEIGFIVRHITSQGYIYFGPIGGHDANIVVGQRVYVHTIDHGKILGVIGKKPIHLMDAKEREKNTVLHELFVDIGATSGKDVLARVSVGDPITYAAPFQRLEGDLVVAHAIDDKVGAFVVAETVRLLAQERASELQAGVFGVCTVQEEVGLRGARTSSYVTGATVGVAIDVGHASDYPGVDKRRTGEADLGKGPVITRGPNINPQVFKLLIEAAHAEDIPYQVDANGAGTGTDANAMQLNQGGMATALVSIPLRYMHTPCEVMSLSDAHNASRLLAAFIRRLTPDVDFTPSLENLRPPRIRRAKAAADAASASDEQSEDS